LFEARFFNGWKRAEGLAMRVIWPILLLSLSSWAATTAAKRPVRLLVSAIEDSTKVEPVGPGATGSRVVRAQILLDRAAFSPGQIDGQYGDDLSIAIKGYQETHNLTPSGTIDAEMWGLLNADVHPLLIDYTITALDVKGPFEVIPKDPQEQAKMKWLGYESPEEGLGEKFHVSPKLLAELNPGLDLKNAGVAITVPEVKRTTGGHAVRVVVSKSKRTVTAYGVGDKILAQYPATIGGEHDPLPIGHWTITSVSRNPWFFYNPDHFWYANPATATAKVPPGPRNPVGVVWMGLSKEHYGIHGTPDPGHIRHGESAGCIRLTNWDASALASMVRRGTPAILEE
jgi:lipoprotein-anchoring transpeptidase ErfK/SrfK